MRQPEHQRATAPAGGQELKHFASQIRLMTTAVAATALMAGAAMAQDVTIRITTVTVSYTHLTLPTKRIV